jgi:hypothetical protein
MKALKIAALFVASASLLQAGCGDSESESTGAGVGAERAAKETPSTEHVTVGGLLAQIRGHHRAVVERYEADDRNAALEHARHPSKEILDSLRPELAKDAETAAALPRSLAAVTTAVREGRPARDVRASVAEAAAITRQAEPKLVGAASGGSAYRGSVVASLASLAAHEYEEALDGDRVARLDEFQDGYGFVREAAALYGEIEPAVQESSSKEAEEITEGFEQLERAMPSGEAPRNPVSVEDVEQAAKLIGAELEETVGATPVTESDPREVEEEIELMLDDVLEAYDPQSPDRAAELAAETYLEHYEVIEPRVIDAAPDVNAELEPLLGAELRKRIREGVPPEQIEELVTKAKQLLAQAIRAVEAAE